MTTGTERRHSNSISEPNSCLSDNDSDANDTLNLYSYHSNDNDVNNTMYQLEWTNDYSNYECNSESNDSSNESTNQASSESTTTDASEQYPENATTNIEQLRTRKRRAEQLVATKGTSNTPTLTIIQCRTKLQQETARLNDRIQRLSSRNASPTTNFDSTTKPTGVLQSHHRQSNAGKHQPVPTASALLSTEHRHETKSSNTIADAPPTFNGNQEHHSRISCKHCGATPVLPTAHKAAKLFNHKKSQSS